MKRKNNDPPVDCQKTLLAVEKNPLDLPAYAQSHVSACRACSEARVFWLALEDFEPSEAPVGYFENLPARIMHKMPAPPANFRMRNTILASAASLLLMAAGGGYWFGRQDSLRPIVMEALMPPMEMQDFYQDPTSFSSIELYSQAPYLTQEEMDDLMNELKKPEAGFQPEPDRPDQ